MTLSVRYKILQVIGPKWVGEDHYPYGHFKNDKVRFEQVDTDDFESEQQALDAIEFNEVDKYRGMNLIITKIYSS